MAQIALPPLGPTSPLDSHPGKSLWRRILGRANGAPAAMESFKAQEAGLDDDVDDDPRQGLIRRVSRKVVPGLPRAPTFKRQQSELRNNLEPTKPTSAERRALSVDRRRQTSQANSQCPSNPRSSAPDFLHNYSSPPSVPSVPTSPISHVGESMLSSIGELSAPVPPLDDVADEPPVLPDTLSQMDAASMTTSQYDHMIHEELERIWILNLSMHFRDKSKREKFFVTYREKEGLWRRVTISLDYRNAPENSLEMDLIHTKFQRDKNAKIYEAIRESLADIQFYETVTNLKLQTTDGRLHVHVVEDTNEIVHFPTVQMIQHLRCRRIRERDIVFDSHMSGFVYKVRVGGQMLIKKEIPGPDTIDEFLYEVNALSRLHSSHHVIELYGVIVDDSEREVKGLLISFAEQGALIDMIYDGDHLLSWATREKWARQIVQGLADIHEAGFVQGDFTLSNIVIDSDDDAKIIDINRRGCPVGWEPPEATPLIESNQRISMYIGVKSDLYQLGMVLWALATQEDEPERHGRPLEIDDDIEVPAWYRTIVKTCLAEDPKVRAQAMQLLHLFPAPDAAESTPPEDYFGDRLQNGQPRIMTANPPPEWSYVGMGHTYVDPATGFSNEPYYYPTRGRSPPSPMPSNRGCESPGRNNAAWSGSPYGSSRQFASISNIGPAAAGPEGSRGRGRSRSVSTGTGTGTESLPLIRISDELEGDGGETLRSMVRTPDELHRDTEQEKAAAALVRPNNGVTHTDVGDTEHHSTTPNQQPQENTGEPEDATTHQGVTSSLLMANDAGNTAPAAPTDGSTKAEAATTTAQHDTSTVDARDSPKGPQIDSASKETVETAEMETETAETTDRPPSTGARSSPIQNPYLLTGIGAVHGAPDDDATRAQRASSIEADLELATTATINDDETT